MTLLTLLLVGLIYFCLNSNTRLQTPLSWDEVHYSSLADKGILYNALEKNSLSFIGFYKIGKARADKDTLLNSQLVKEYSYPDENLNPFYLRHYHPPLATYYWSLFTGNTNLFIKDKLLRISNIILGSLTILSLLISLYIAKIKNREAIGWMIILSCLLVVSNIFNYSFETLNFHTFQFLFSVLFVAFLMRWINNLTNKNAILVGVSTALMFLSLETALFVVSGAVLALIITKQLKKLLQFALPIFGSFFLSMFIMWPGVVKTLAPIKTWVMYAARIFLKDNDEYVKVDMTESWKILFLENFILFGVLILLVITLLLISKKTTKTKNYLIPYIVAFVYLLSITPFILNKTYIFPVIGLLIFALIYNLFLINFKLNSTIVKLNSIAQYVLILVIGVIIAISIFNMDYTSKVADNKSERIEFNRDVEELKSVLANQKNVIAFNGQSLRYYLQDESVVDLRKNKMENPGYYIRENGLYKDVTIELKQHIIDAVVIPINYLEYYPSEKTEMLEQFNFKKVTLSNYQVFLAE